MYTAFYGLREKPFALVPDPRYLFLSEAHREALAHLLYGIDQGEGFIAVTGEVGTGKTTICRTLLERLGAETEVAFLFNPSLTGIELLQDISAEFGLEAEGKNRSELGAQLNRFLLAKKEDRRRVLLIIDEAQNLSEDTLEQVRLLSNLETSSSKLIQILLLGQPELDAKLDSPELRQLRQRISVRWGLGPLSARETREYAKHRLHVAAGAERTIFTDGGLREIHRRTGGVPRLINVLCDRALLAGYVAKAPTIGARLVKQAASEIQDASRRRWFGSRRRAARTTQRPGLAVGVGAAVGAAIGVALLATLMVAVGGLPTISFRSLEPSPAASVDARAVSEVASPPPTLGAESLPVESSVEPRDEQSASADSLSALEPMATLVLVEPRDLETAPMAEVPMQVEPTPSVGAAAPEPPDTVDLAIVALDGAEPGAPRAVLLDLSDTGPGAAAAPARGFVDGSFLALALENEDVATSRLEAVNALLRSFGQAPSVDAPQSDASALAQLADRGLAVLPIRWADVATLRALNHPALLRVGGPGAEPRLIALRQLEEDRAWLYGLMGDQPLRVPLSELNAGWSGEAWVVWNEFEDVRAVLAFGHHGGEVTWLQSSLAELGYYEGEASGLFDAPTRESVRALQLERSIPADGIAGPRTRMVLYDLLDRYDVPRLVDQASERQEDAG